MKLYEITAEMRELQVMADIGELTQEMIADTLEALDCEFEKKAEAALMVRQGMLAEVAGIDSEIKRLESLKAAPAASAVRLTEYIKSNMLVLGKDKADLGLFKVTLRKATDKLGTIDEDKVPSEFWSIVPESKKIDKRALLAYAKVNDIDGVEITKSERSLTIK
ncbi:siphovirus Gp157 family protein [bacterium]|nr:siphovirus Gp157 family protein [bacterium]